MVTGTTDSNDDNFCMKYKMSSCIFDDKGLLHAGAEGNKGNIL